MGSSQTSPLDSLASNGPAKGISSNIQSKSRSVISVLTTGPLGSRTEKSTRLIGPVTVSKKHRNANAGSGLFEVLSVLAAIWLVQAITRTLSPGCKVLI
jgi:hypothetical protein